MLNPGVIGCGTLFLYGNLSQRDPDTAIINSNAFDLTVNREGQCMLVEDPHGIGFSASIVSMSGARSASKAWLELVILISEKEKEFNLGHAPGAPAHLARKCSVVHRGHPREKSVPCSLVLAQLEMPCAWRLEEAPSTVLCTRRMRTIQRRWRYILQRRLCRGLCLLCCGLCHLWIHV